MLEQTQNLNKSLKMEKIAKFPHLLVEGFTQQKNGGRTEFKGLKVVGVSFLVFGAILPWKLLDLGLLQVLLITAGLFLLIVEAWSAQYSLPTPLLVLALVFLGLLSLELLADKGFSSYLLSATIGVVVAYSHSAEFAKYSLLILLCLTVALQIIETLRHAYIFTVSFESLQLDERLFSGVRGIFRAKGIFYGPLSAAYFALLVAIIWRGNYLVLSLSFLCAYMAQARFVLIILLAGFVLIGLKKLNIQKKIATLFICIFILLFFISITEQITITNFLQAFDLSDSRNIGRIYYWQQGLQLFGTHDLTDQLIGVPGATRKTFYNSSENDYIQAINEVGLIGFLAMLFASIYIAKRSQNPWIVLFAIAAFVAAPIASLPLGTTYWIVLSARGSKLLVSKTMDSSPKRVVKFTQSG